MKRILKHHPELMVTKQIVKDSVYVKDSIIIKHDTINIKGEEVKIHDTIPCPTLEYHRSVTKNNLTAKVDISHGIINVDCKADSLQKIIDVLQHEKTIYKSYSSDTTRTVEIRRANWFDKFCYWWFGITLLLIILWVANKYLKITTRF